MLRRQARRAEATRVGQGHPVSSSPLGWRWRRQTARPSATLRAPDLRAPPPSLPHYTAGAATPRRDRTWRRARAAAAASAATTLGAVTETVSPPTAAAGDLDGGIADGEGEAGAPLGGADACSRGGGDGGVGGEGLDNAGDRGNGSGGEGSGSNCSPRSPGGSREARANRIANQLLPATTAGTALTSIPHDSGLSSSGSSNGGGGGGGISSQALLEAQQSARHALRDAAAALLRDVARDVFGPSAVANVTLCRLLKQRMPDEFTRGVTAKRSLFSQLKMVRWACAWQMSGHHMGRVATSRHRCMRVCVEGCMHGRERP
eukprot:360189-Chlamydomonas_euryale.AAC.3